MARSRKFHKTDIEGMDDLERKLKRMTDDVMGEHLRGAVDQAGEIPRKVASDLAPRSADGSHGREPGFLSRNIVKEVQWTRTQETARIHIGMTKEAFYGALQETGTTHHPAQPFLRPAFDETKDSVTDEIRDVLRARILGTARSS